MATTLNVQFSDATESSIIAVFGAPQNGSAYPNQGEIGSGDTRYSAYYDALPTWARAALPAPGA